MGVAVVLHDLSKHELVPISVRLRRRLDLEPLYTKAFRGFLWRDNAAVESHLFLELQDLGLKLAQRSVYLRIGAFVHLAAPHKLALCFPQVRTLLLKSSQASLESCAIVRQLGEIVPCARTPQVIQ